MLATKVGNWFKNWHPVTIPLLLLVIRIGISLKLGNSYDFVKFPSDVAYYGVTFYVWALTAKSTGISVCPRGMGEGEWNYVILFLIANFAVYIFSIPTPAGVSFSWAFVFTFFALLTGFASPVFLRWR